MSHIMTIWDMRKWNTLTRNHNSLMGTITFEVHSITCTSPRNIFAIIFISILIFFAFDFLCIFFFLSVACMVIYAFLLGFSSHAISCLSHILNNIYDYGHAISLWLGIRFRWNYFCANVYLSLTESGNTIGSWCPN